MEELERLLAELSDPAAPGTEPRAPPAAAMQAVEDALQARLGGRDEEVRARLDGLAEQIEWLHREGGAGAGGAVEERLRALEARSALRTSSAQPLAQVRAAVLCAVRGTMSPTPPACDMSRVQ